MNVTKSDLYKIYQALSEIRRIAAMETMSLQTYRMSPKLDIDNSTLTQIVKSSTDLWRDSYIITPLDETLETLKKYISL